MPDSRTSRAISRRRAVAGLGASGAAIALARTATPVMADEGTPSALAGHPIVGAWLGMLPITPDAPPVPIPSVYSPNGQISLAWPVTGAGAQGVTFSSSALGTWEAVGERGAHFTAVQVLTDAAGAFTGTITIDGHPTVSADGQTILDESPDTMLTIRDAVGAVVMTVGGDGSFPPVTGYRMAPGAPGFPEPAT